MKRTEEASLQPADAEPERRSRARFELILASVCLAFGFFVLPAAIYAVGQSLLGPYGEAQNLGLGRFYADYFGDLAEPAGRTWLLALGPLVLVEAIRLCFVGVKGSSPDEPPEEAPRRPTRPERVEPRIGEE
ncbi:MAG TPA: hypothetical protein VF193_12385 [Steroidobacter sp.]|jgi:hypothetical protein